MKRMLQYLKPYWGSMILAMLIITVSTFCDLLLPAIMSNILNLGVYQQDFSYICRCCLYMAVISLVGLLAVLIGSWISTYVVSGFCADVRTEVFQKVNRMSFEEFGAMGTAALVTRATHDVETVSWVAAELSGTAATIPVLFIGGVILAMRKDIWLSLILLAFVPVILAAVVLIGKRILPLWEKSDEYIDRQNDLMRQRLRGIRVIRAFGAESREHERIAEATHTMAKTIIDCNVSMGLITPLASFLLNCAALLIVYIGGWRMESGSSLTGGDVFAIVQYISLVSSGVIMGAFACPPCRPCPKSQWIRSQRKNRGPPGPPGSRPRNSAKTKRAYPYCRAPPPSKSGWCETGKPTDTKQNPKAICDWKRLYRPSAAVFSFDKSSA